MNILVIVPHNMLHDAPVVFAQEKAFLQAGHTLTYLSALPVGKRTPSGSHRFPLVRSTWRNLPVYYIRYFSASTFGEMRWNAASAKISIELLAARMLKEIQPDVILAHTIGLCGQLGTVLKRKSGLPLVITTHGSDTNKFLKHGMHQYLKRICDKADVVVAVSEVLKNNLAQCGTVTPISCIWNGFAVEHIVQVPKVSRRIIQASNLVEGKHIDVTISVVARLREIYPDISLTIVGSGPKEEELKKLCRKKKIDDVTRFTGRLTNAETIAEMGQAEVFLMPSYPEGFGIAYVEAMASGCVSIGIRGEGIDGVILSDINGFLVEKDDVDAIIQIIDNCFRDRALMQKITDAGRGCAMELTWEKNVQEYSKLFCNLVDAKKNA